MVQGADVWLNTPLRPLEASGTSGMKAAANGALNISTLDGWWDEAWRESGSNLIGWAIGRGETYEDRGYQDEVEANALYDLLEQDVIPTFYERGPGRLPRRWIQRMKASIGGLCCQYNTHRMVREYAERFYLMAHARFRHLAAGDASRARTLAEWMERVRLAWPEVRIDSIDDGPRTSIPVGERVRTRARVCLGSLSPSDVAVELYMGRVDADGDIDDATARQMEPAGIDEQGRHTFEVEAVVCCRSGLQGYTVRILPYHPDLPTAFLPGLITWAS
jgi:starch phosphorylase